MRILLLVMTLTLPLAAARAAEPLAEVTRYSDGLVLQPKMDAAGYTLTVSLPDGTVLQRFSPAGFGLDFFLRELAEEPADGTYTYQLVATPWETEDPVALPRQSGYFRVLGGEVILGTGESREIREPTAGGLQSLPTADRVFGDTVVINGNLCAGEGGCANGENFGDDMFRLKDDDPHIHFEDTSTGTFPSNDWRIMVNSTSDGGADFFTIEDSTGGNDLFTLEAGAPANALYVDDQGRLGLRTATPAAEIHLQDGDTPTLRLEQDTSLSLTAQTWEVGGDASEFFLKDVTHSSKVPFKVVADAPADSLVVTANGDVGLGTATPAYDLHVENTAAGDHADLTLETAAETWTIRSNANSARLIFFRNDDSAVVPFFIDESAPADLVQIGFPNDQVSINGQLNVNDYLNVSGNLTINNTILAASASLDSATVSGPLRIGGSNNWEINGASDFLLKDLAHSSKVPLKVVADAPADSVVVTANGDVGIGTATPASDLHVKNTATLDHADLTLETVSETWTIRSNANSSRLAFFRNNDVSVVPFFIDESAPADLMQVGFPNDQVSINGQLNVNGNLVVSGTCTGCDAVFSPEFPLKSIDEQAEFMFENSYLPAVGPTPEGPTQINVFEKTTGILQELEKAHIYIAQLNARLLERDERIEALERAVRALQQPTP